MRRSSLVAPLLLILIGGLFLLNNIRPDLPLLDMLGRFWPFLLIGWGVLRLVEIVFWAAQGKPLPQAGISGGEWVLVVLLCIVGSGLFFAHRRFSGWPNGRITMRGIELLGEPYDFPLAEQKQAVSKTPRIVIENLRGNARVVGSDALEVKVSGRKTVRAMRQNEASDANNKSPLELVVQGDQVTIRTNQERVSSELRVSCDLEITVPKGASIEGRGRYGDFDITDLGGSVDINSDNAGVRLQSIGGSVRTDLRRSDIVRAANVKGSVEVKSNRGQDIELENIEGQVTISGAYSGEVQFRNLAKPVRYEAQGTDLQFEKLPGQLRMALGDLTATNIVGPIRLHSRSRDIQLTDFSQSVEITLDRGDIELHPQKSAFGRMDVQTRSGNIELALPPAARFALKATTERGEVENDYGAPLKIESEGRTTTLVGTVGQGPELRLSTNRGSIAVRKGTAADVERAQVPKPPVPARPPAAPLEPERQ